MKYSIRWVGAYNVTKYLNSLKFQLVKKEFLNLFDAEFNLYEEVNGIKEKKETYLVFRSLTTWQQVLKYIENLEYDEILEKLNNC